MCPEGFRPWSVPDPMRAAMISWPIHDWSSTGFQTLGSSGHGGGGIPTPKGSRYRLLGRASAVAGPLWAGAPHVMCAWSRSSVCSCLGAQAWRAWI
eukprot:154179-Pyramimonas_sp.AAC.1